MPVSFLLVVSLAVFIVGSAVIGVAVFSKPSQQPKRLAFGIAILLFAACTDVIAARTPNPRAILYSIQAFTQRPSLTTARVVATMNDPAFLVGCRSQQFRKQGHRADVDLTFTIFNRTTHDLLAFYVDYRAYDAKGTEIGAGSQTKTLSVPLAASAQHPIDIQASMNLYKTNPIAYASCEIRRAFFKGNHEWDTGEQWLSEPLLPI